MPTALELLTTEVCDDILTIDLESRKIIIPNTVQNLGVESDDNVRVLHFRLPRYYCEVDLSEFIIRINYENAKGSGDVYLVPVTQIKDDVIEFDWKVGRYAVTYKGNVVFNVCLKDYTDGVVNREFNTTIATLPVLEGLETGEAIIQEHADVLEQWHDDLFGIGNTVEQQIRDTGTEVMSDIKGSVATYVADNADSLRGEKGDTGATFTPSVDSNGNISWTNDKGLTNPKTQNIKGDKGNPFTYDMFTVEQLEALKGEDGASIASIVRTSGTGAAGTIDTYTITLDNGNTSTFQVYNGADGEGAGDMLKQIYDPQNKNTDVFAYIDNKEFIDNVARTAEGTLFSDGKSFQEKYDSGELKGEKGDTFTYEDLTDEQRAALKGESGRDGEMPLVAATSTDGVSYIATVDGMDSLVVGKEIMIVPNFTTTVVNPTLNVNGLGAKYLRCPLTSNNVSTATGPSETWIYKDKPVKVRWNGSYWVTDIYRIDANSLYGTAPIESGGTGATTSDAARTNLDVYSKAEVDAAISAAIETAIGDAIGGSY